MLCFIGDVVHSVSYYVGLDSYSQLVFFGLCVLIAPLFFKILYHVLGDAVKIGCVFLFFLIVGAIFFFLVIFVILPILGAIFGW